MDTSFTLKQAQQLHNWHKENLIENIIDVHNITYLYKNQSKNILWFRWCLYESNYFNSGSQILLQILLIFDLKHFLIKDIIVYAKVVYFEKISYFNESSSSALPFL